MRRREFLGGALALGASSAFPLLSGCSGSAPLSEVAGWNPGRVAHLLPAAERTLVVPLNRRLRLPTRLTS